jgi:hypothetical protein
MLVDERDVGRSRTYAAAIAEPDGYAAAATACRREAAGMRKSARTRAATPTAASVPCRPTIRAALLASKPLGSPIPMPALCHFAMVMGTPTLLMSPTVVWNRTLSIWNDVRSHAVSLTV